MGVKLGEGSKIEGGMSWRSNAIYEATAYSNGEFIALDIRELHNTLVETIRINIPISNVRQLGDLVNTHLAKYNVKLKEKKDELAELEKQVALKKLEIEKLEEVEE